MTARSMVGRRDQIDLSRSRPPPLADRERDVRGEGLPWERREDALICVARHQPVTPLPSNFFLNQSNKKYIPIFLFLLALVSATRKHFTVVSFHLLISHVRASHPRWPLLSVCHCCGITKCTFHTYKN